MLKLFSSSEPEIAAPPVLNTRVEPHIRIINGSLDESEVSSAGLILNGRVDTSTLRFLKVDSSYQRPLADRADIYAALQEGKVVPNIEVGVRGQDFDTDGDDYIIHSPAFIIDGWQRTGNALKLLERIPHHPIRIFATLHFGTDEIWERHRFTELNKNVRRISPNLHLRNMRDSSGAVLTLYGLSNSDRSFVLNGKVCWPQAMQRGHLISALTLSKTAAALHSHAGSIDGGTPERVAAHINRLADAVSLANFRRNISSFYSIVNDCWPFAAIEFRASAPQIKGTFLMTLARVFAMHPAFWDSDGRILSVSRDDQRKLAKFPITDPHISELAGSTGKSRNILYRLIVDHMNSGRRNNRLRSRFEGDE